MLSREEIRERYLIYPHKLRNVSQLMTVEDKESELHDLLVNVTADMGEVMHTYAQSMFSEGTKHSGISYDFSRFCEQIIRIVLFELQRLPKGNKDDVDRV